ncbi:IS21 family transposase [Sorangium sp. So ce590]|uniref:IS21 family transposase n=1 Tax=Sorangium sp. So ce590 TaxID=3133317 RepID=UPI003F63DDBA
MHQAREILRQKLTLKQSHREVVAALGVSIGTVSKVAGRAMALGLDWTAIEALDDEALDERLFGPRITSHDPRPLPDPASLHVELRRPGVTLQLLHLEYLEHHPDGYRYTKFCDVYRAWLDQRAPTMRQVHAAGDKMFVDYAGKKPHYVERATGEVVEVELFVAVLGASSYTYAEATRTQRLADFTASNARAFTFFGGVTNAVVPDQLKSAVTVSSRYEPGVQRTFAELGRHYGTTILPARPRSPRDKAKVEVAVLVAERWILARMRNEQFDSLGALNARIAELCAELNRRVMRHYKASRLELFERLDKPALRPLPEEPFVHAEWTKTRLNIDYHAKVRDHFYSAPFTLVHEELWARSTATTVELFHSRGRVASHLRSDVPGRHTTDPQHMPASHQKHAEWTPTRILGWASTVGPMTAMLSEAILAERRHPEHGYRSCLGLFRLAKRFGNERVEAACGRALAVGARSYRHVESILKHGLDRAPMLDNAPREAPSVAHENVRGSDYYH